MVKSAESELRGFGIIERNHRPEHIDEDVVHAFLAEEPAGCGQGRAGQRRVLFPEGIADAEERLAEAICIADFQCGEQLWDARNNLRECGESSFRPIERTQPGEFPLGAWQQGVIECTPRLPPDFPEVAQPAARFGLKPRDAFVWQKSGEPEEMREPRLRIERAQFCPRQALRDEPHRDLISRGIRALSANASWRACSGLVRRVRQNQRRAFWRRRKSPAARRMSTICSVGNFPSSGEQRPGTAPGRGRCRERGTERLQFRPRRDELRAEHDLRYAAKGSGRGEEGSPFAFPHDVENRFVVSGVGVMTVRVPVAGSQVDFDVARLSRRCQACRPC